jgi:lysophospholipase L1-like esterase
MMIEKGSRLVMAGDSVTDCGRNYTLPPCFWSTWGDGYVHVVYSAFLSLAPDRNIMVVNQGVSGNTSADLDERWNRDIMSLSPDYVSIMIGINDVWRHFDSVVRQEKLIDKEMFRENLRSIMKKTVPSVKHVFLMTPVMFEINKTEPMFVMLKEYDAVIKETAEEYGQTFIDTQSYVDRVLAYQHPYMFTTDRVHPNLPGHFIIARSFLDAAGLFTETR